jgi:hypothetical protein
VPPPAKPVRFYRGPSPADPVSLDEWQKMSEADRAKVMEAGADLKNGSQFNEQTGDDIE